MKMRLFMIVIATGTCFLFACNNNTQQSSTPQTAATFKSKNSDTFNIAFDSVLTEYSILKNAFINWDTAAANQSATALQLLLISVPYNSLSDDAVATKATSIAQNAADAIDALKAQDSISSKRRIFYTVSESVYNLAKTVGYDEAVVYHKKCPMAFNGDQEGWWLSQSKKVDDNPYFGKFHPKYKNAMLECGTVEDSINNRQ